MLAALMLAAVLGQIDPCVDFADGTPFATCFDPGNRLALGGELGSDGKLSLETGLRLRRSRESRSHAHVTWFSEHDLGAGELRVQEGRWVAEGVAYDGLFSRHLEDGFLLLPTRTPLRIPFPFDIAVEVRLGALERSEDGQQRLEVGRAGLLLDLARDPAGLQRLAFGPSLSDAVERDAAGVRRNAVQPLTGATLLLREESADGLWAVRARVDAGRELLLPGQGRGRASASADVERVLFAVDDQPVSLQLSGRSVWRSGARSEVRVGVGLVAAYQL